MWTGRDGGHTRPDSARGPVRAAFHRGLRVIRRQIAMSIRVQCHCGNAREVDDDLQGRDVFCAACEQRVSVPSANGDRGSQRDRSRLYWLILIAFLLAAVAFLLYRWANYAEERAKLHGAASQGGCRFGGCLGFRNRPAGMRAAAVPATWAQETAERLGPQASRSAAWGNEWAKRVPS
jgi:hypothetical protein